MGRSRNWLGIVRRKFRRSSHRNIIVLHTNTTSDINLDEEIALREREEAISVEETNGAVSYFPSSQITELSREDIAAIKIQTVFRGHLARRAYRALRSLVKLQALVRGVCVRKQTRIALHCMHALVRLQITVRARQLLSRCSDD